MYFSLNTSCPAEATGVCVSFNISVLSILQARGGEYINCGVCKILNILDCCFVPDLVLEDDKLLGKALNILLAQLRH